MPLAALISGGASLLGGALANRASSAQAERAMDFSRIEAERNRRFQKRMSDTSHQREVADLKKAGLNPVLSANRGASTPGGSSGSGFAAPQRDVVTPAVTTALAARRNKQELRNMEAQEKLLETQQIQSQAAAAHSAAQYRSEHARGSVMLDTYHQQLRRAEAEAQLLERDAAAAGMPGGVMSRYLRDWMPPLSAVIGALSGFAGARGVAGGLRAFGRSGVPRRIGQTLGLGR